MAKGRREHRAAVLVMQYLEYSGVTSPLILPNLFLPSGYCSRGVLIYYIEYRETNDASQLCLFLRQRETLVDLTGSGLHVSRDDGDGGDERGGRGRSRLGRKRNYIKLHRNSGYTNPTVQTRRAFFFFFSFTSKGRLPRGKN